MKYLFTGMALMAGLFFADGVAQTPSPEKSCAQQAFACPHCGAALVHPAVAVSPAAVTNPVVAGSPAVVTSPVVEVDAAMTTNRAVRDWKANVYGGFAAQSGNSDTKAYTYGVEYSQRGKIYRGRVKLDGKYGETQDEVTASKSEASGEMRRMLDERWFSYGVLSATHDDLKDLIYRVKTGPGLGYYFIDTKDLKVDAGSGPLYVHEKTSKTDSGYLAWRIAQGIDWQMTDTFRWWSLLELDVDTTDTSAYTFEAKTGIESKINDRASLLLTMEDDYDSHPEAKGSVEKNDFQISTGVRYNF